jgi:hypothetical protein
MNNQEKADRLEQLSSELVPLLKPVVTVALLIDVEKLREYTTLMEESIQLYKTTGCHFDSPDKYRKTVTQTESSFKVHVSLLRLIKDIHDGR